MSLLKTLYRKFFPGSSSAHKLFWRYRYAFRKNILTDDEIITTTNHLHRQELINEIKQFQNVKSLIELGSSWGPNLLLLSQIYPELKCFGIDVSARMIREGNRLIKEKNLQNIRLINSDFISLKRFKNKEFDLTITDAALIYVDKKKHKQLC